MRFLIWKTRRGAAAVFPPVVGSVEYPRGGFLGLGMGRSVDAVFYFVKYIRTSV